MSFLNSLRERFRDNTRDRLYEELKSLGIDAKVAQPGRSEKEIAPSCSGGSHGPIYISKGPIRWINVRSINLGSPTWLLSQTRYYIDYGVPDERLVPFSRELEIKLVRKKTAPIFGQIVDSCWKGRPSGLGIINRLNNDLSITTILMSVKKLRIHTDDYRDVIYGNWYRCWVIETRTRMPPSMELWNCYQKIARYLLA